MRLREAIKHAKEVAAKLPKDSKRAKEHLQLAEWLKELQFHRKQRQDLGMLEYRCLGITK